MPVVTTTGERDGYDNWKVFKNKITQLGNYGIVFEKSGILNVSSKGVFPVIIRC